MSSEKIVDDILKPPNCECLIPLESRTEHHWSKNDKLRWTVTFFFGSMLVYSVRVSMSISAPAIGKELGWNKQISGMALSAFFCGYVLTNVLGGYLADRIGGQIVIFYTALGWGMLTLMLPYFARTESIIHSGTAAVLFTRFLTGVCQGVFFPSLTSMLTKHVAVAERGFILGFTNSGCAIGTTATGFLGSLIVEHFNWAYLFMVVGIFTLLWTIWLKYLMSLTAAPIITKDDAKPKEPVPWIKLASHTPFWALLVAYFTNSYCFYNLLSWTPLYFHDAFPESKGWVFNVVPWVVTFVLAIISGYYADKLIVSGSSLTFVRKLFAALMFLGTGVFSLMLNSVETFKQALFIMSLNIGVNAFGSCSVIINPTDLAPRHSGALHGFMNSCGAFAGFIGVYLTGYILETTGKWSSVFMLTSGSAFIGFISYQLFGSGERIV